RPKRRKQKADGERRRQNPDLKFGRSLPDRHRDVKLVEDHVEQAESQRSRQIAAKIVPGIRSRLKLETLNSQADADHGHTFLLNEMMDEWLAKSGRRLSGKAPGFFFHFFFSIQITIIY